MKMRRGDCSYIAPPAEAFSFKQKPYLTEAFSYKQQLVRLEKQILCREK